MCGSRYLQIRGLGMTSFRAIYKSRFSFRAQVSNSAPYKFKNARRKGRGNHPVRPTLTSKTPSNLVLAKIIRGLFSRLSAALRCALLRLVLDKLARCTSCKIGRNDESKPRTQEERYYCQRQALFSVHSPTSARSHLARTQQRVGALVAPRPRAVDRLGRSWLVIGFP